MCSDTFQSLRGLSGHRRYCPGKIWECDWCNDRKSKIKGIGPNGPGSLCGTCAGRYKCGFIGLPVANPVTGKFNCESCENPFERYVRALRRTFWSNALGDIRAEITIRVWVRRRTGGKRCFC